MAGFIRAQPGRVVFDEVIASGATQKTGITAWVAYQPGLRYNSYNISYIPSTSAGVLVYTTSTSSAAITLGSSSLLRTTFDVPRAVKVSPSTSQVATGNVTVTGVNQFGVAKTDTIALAGTGAPVNGAVAFKTISQVVLPASTSNANNATGVGITVGFANIYGADRQLFSVGTCVRGAVNGTAETTAPIMNTTNHTASFTTAATSSTGNLVELVYLTTDVADA